MERTTPCGDRRPPEGGGRPGVLKEPEPQGRLARRERVCDAPAPLMVSLHVVDDAHIDHSTLLYLLALTLAAQKEEEKRKEKQVARRRFFSRQWHEQSWFFW